MAIDGSIPASVTLPQLVNPMSVFAQSQQMRAVGLENEQRQMALDEAKKKQAEDDAFKAAIQSSAGMTSDQLLEHVRTAAPGSFVAVQKAVTEAQEKAAATKKANEDAASAHAAAATKQQEFIGHLADQIHQSDYNPIVVNTALNEAVAQFPEWKDHADQIRQIAATQGKDALKAVITPLISSDIRKANAETNRPVDMAPGNQLVDPHTGQVIHAAPDRTSFQSKDVLLDGKRAVVNFDPRSGKYVDPSGQDVSARVAPIPPASLIINDRRERGSTMPEFALTDARPTGPDGNKPDPTIRMTPNGLHQAALTYISSGQYPPTGRGTDPISVAQREAINAKVGAIAAASGMDVPTLRAFYKSNSASLTAMQKASDSVQAFMGTADKNAELLRGVLKNVPDTGIPLFNQPLRSFATNVQGDPNMAKMATYLQSVQNEYARIISQPNLAGQLTDSARHEAETLLSKTATVKQMLASLDALQTEGTNRVVSIGEQIQRISSRMQTGPGQPPASAPTAVPQAAPSSTGKIRARDPQGNLHEAPAGTPLPAGWKLEGGG